MSLSTGLIPLRKGEVEVMKTNQIQIRMSYSRLRNIGKNRQAAAARITPPSKQYTPYSFTNIALYFINRGLFYSPIVGLQNKPIFIYFRAILVELWGVLISRNRGSD